MSAEPGLEAAGEGGWHRKLSKRQFLYFKSSAEPIWLDVLMYVRSALSFRKFEDLRHERGKIDITHMSMGAWEAQPAGLRP